MATAVFVKDGDCCKYFVCFAPEENKTVDVAETVVEREAFKNADGVEYVSFEKCETVKQFAFEDCRELKAVVWGKASKDNTNEENEKKTEKGLIGLAVSEVANLTIQSGAFKDCTKLQAVVFPKVSGKLVIEKDAFAGCSNLRTVVFPTCAGKIEIRDDAFHDCFKEMLHFIVSKQSVAEKYAEKYGFEVFND